MSPEELELLNKSVTLAEDNNKMLHSMKKRMRYASIARAIYWILIIGSAVGAFYFLQPYTDEAVKIYKEAKNNLNNFGSTFQNKPR